MSTAGPEVAVVLRPATTDDVPTLVALERELFGAGAWSAGMLHEELTAPGRWYVAAVDPGAGGGAADHAADRAEDRAADVVGYAGVWFDGHDATVMTIGVTGAHQGRRVGRLLLGALLDHARSRGAGAVLLEVRVDNTPALALYERFGFVRVGRRRGYYQPENADAWTMRLDLSAATGPITAPTPGASRAATPAPTPAPGPEAP